jgi:glycosyl transferase family 25
MDVYLINLPKDQKRAAFQEKQLSKLGLKFNKINAISVNDISQEFYKSVAFNWERPLSKAEVCCYLSHKMIWKLIIENNKEALVLEDDALISNDINIILDLLKNIKSDYINLETRLRKKVVSKTRLSINENYSLRHLYYGGTGAAGYILRPSGAKALLNTEYKNGYALTDSQICRTLFKNPYQLDHAAIIQLDCCEKYLIKNEFKPLSNLRRQRDKYHYKFWFRYKFKRLISQFKQSKRYLKILLPDIERTEIKPLLSSFSKNFKK